MRQAAGCAALDCGAWLSDTRAKIIAERGRLSGALEKMDLTVYRSEANYLLIYSKVPLAKLLHARGILVRDCANYAGLKRGYIRIGVRQPGRKRSFDRRRSGDMRFFLRKSGKGETILKKAKPIMIQGTMSSAGKSLLCAALCRIFRQDGYSVAPFKSQNMALNSFITAEGLEMGRAQVVQAEAAGVRPSVLMNPILLKPTTDVGSQVIVNGEVRGNMRASEYFKYKTQLIPEIMRAYDTLAGQYDIIVLEGRRKPGGN